MYKSLKIKGFYGLPEILIGTSNMQSNAEFSGINVITGPNSTGKTAILKLLYASIKGLQEIKSNALPTKPKTNEHLADKLQTTFMPRNNGLGDLVTKQNGPAEIRQKITNRNGLDLQFGYQIGHESKINISNFESEEVGTFDLDAIFFPAKEILTILNAISYTREQIQLPDFDDTYYDLVKALRIPTVQGKTFTEIRKVSETLEEMFQGKIIQDFENGQANFVYKVGNQKYAMPQTAEGIKKIGILTTLINNRKLRPDTILFFDEPETALHPAAQRQLVKILYDISRLEGVQVFLATHSYYIVNQLHNVALEHEESITCISLDKNAAGERTVDYFNLKDGMPHIPIMEEAFLMQNEETELLISRINR